MSKAVRGIKDVLKVANRVFNWRQEDSEVSLLNQGMVIEPSPQLFQVLSRSRSVCRLTDGAFDPLFRSLQWLRGCSDLALGGYPFVVLRVGQVLDLDAIAKGYIASLIGNRLKRLGIFRFLVEIGGDIYAAKGLDGPWRIGVRSPGRGGVCGVLTLEEKGVCTSGSYERGGHIQDPRTGRSLLRDWSVTVIGPDPATSDALATAAFILGPSWRGYSRFNNYTFVFCSASGVLKIVNSPGPFVEFQASP